MSRNPTDRDADSESEKPLAAPLSGSRALVQIAWIVLGVWIAVLGGLALHVVGVW